MKKIVLISPRSTVQPKIVIPPGLFCKYSTAWPNKPVMRIELPIYS
jgi:hypothetical protein